MVNSKKVFTLTSPRAIIRDMEIKRFLLPHLKKYLHKKILLVSGPRQCGKTTLAKMISEDHDYVNFDNVKDRVILEEQSWDRKKKYIIF